MPRIHERACGSESKIVGIVAIGLVVISISTVALQYSGYSNDNISLMQILESKYDGSAWSLLNRPAQKFVHAVDSIDPSWVFQGVDAKFDGLHNSNPKAAPPSNEDSDSRSHLGIKYAFQKPLRLIRKSKPPTAAEINIDSPTDLLTPVSKRTPSWINLRAKRLLELLDAPPTQIHGPAHRRRHLSAARRTERPSVEQTPPSVAAVTRRSHSAAHAVPRTHSPQVSPSSLKRQLSSGGMQLFTDHFHPLAGAIPTHKAR
jgi:hypothetical protein